MTRQQLDEIESKLRGWTIMRNWADDDDPQKAYYQEMVTKYHREYQQALIEVKEQERIQREKENDLRMGR